jgi:hypothetical protein
VSILRTLEGIAQRQLSIGHFSEDEILFKGILLSNIW